MTEKHSKTKEITVTLGILFTLIFGMLTYSHSSNSTEGEK